MNTVLFGFLGCGSLAAIAYFVSNFIGSDSNIKNIIKSLIQKFKEEKINNIEEKQKPILENIEKNEKLNINTKNKIIEIKKEANKKIIEILNSDNKFSDILTEENKLWN